MVFQEFVEIDSWAHLDIAGVMTNEGDVPYMGSGMSGQFSLTGELGAPFEKGGWLIFTCIDRKQFKTKLRFFVQLSDSLFCN